MESEILVFLFCAIVALPIGLAMWTCIFRVNAMSASMQARMLALTALGGSIAVIVMALAFWSSADVRLSGIYFSLYVMLGLAWMAGTTLLLNLCGLCLRDDLIERRNPATPSVIIGSHIGAATCFAGANIGNGPGPHVVLFCALLATLTLIAAWVGLNRLSHSHAWITIEGDPVTGIRVGMLFIAAGVILGRAVAGDWISLGDTLFDFAKLGFPAIGLFALETLIQRKTEQRFSLTNPSWFIWGLMPSVGYAIATVVFLWVAGPW